MVRVVAKETKCFMSINQILSCKCMSSVCIKFFDYVLNITEIPKSTSFKMIFQFELFVV